MVDQGWVNWESHADIAKANERQKGSERKWKKKRYGCIYGFILSGAMPT